MISSLLHRVAEYSYDYNSLYETTTDTDSMSVGAIVAIVLVSLAFAVFMIAATWRVFTKAKKPGWAAIIPIYNTYVMLKIVGRPGWWLLLYFIPIVNIFVAIVVTYELAKAFGKDVGYTLLLLFLPVIGWPMLAWGSAKYKKPKQR